jgi:hypothetical protein
MDTADIQDWIKTRRERVTAPDHLSAIDALAICLNGNGPPNAIATSITKAYSSYVEQPLKNSESDRVQSFWVLLCDAARMFGSAQSRLIDLLHEMSKQPDIYATDGSKTTGGMVYWRDLPGLPFALCDDALCPFTLIAYSHLLMALFQIIIIRMIILQMKSMSFLDKRLTY